MLQNRHVGADKIAKIESLGWLFPFGIAKSFGWVDFLLLLLLLQCQRDFYALETTLPRNDDPFEHTECLLQFWLILLPCICCLHHVMAMHQCFPPRLLCSVDFVMLNFEIYVPRLATSHSDISTLKQRGNQRRKCQSKMG